MGAYDRRRYAGKRQQIQLNTGAPGNRHQTVYDVARSTTSVLSYRSNPTGELVSDQIADPYSYFLSGVSRGRREAASAAQRLGSGESAVLDNGHNFLLTRHKLLSTTKSGRWKESTAPSAFDCTGGLLTTCGQNFYSWAESDLLFGYTVSPTSTDKRLFTTPFAHIGSWDPYYWGSKAIQALAPNRPEINLSVTLAELLREGLPKRLLGESIDTFLKINRFKWRDFRKVSLQEIADFNIKNIKVGTKAFSKDYLNFMFAFQPFASDIIKLQEVCFKASSLIDQYYKDAGKGVRRSMELKNTSQVKPFLEPGWFTSLGKIGLYPENFPATFGSTAEISGQSIANFSTCRNEVTQSLTERIWFSGSFSYYLPVPDGFWGRVETYNTLWARLYGAPISLEALWELTPWSWLVDWFIDLQRIFAVADRLQDDNLVINYGYLMREVKATTLIRSKFTYDEANNRSIPEVVSVYESVRKERIRCNPFGFSLKTPEELNTIQMSLLASLGFSKFL